MRDQKIVSGDPFVDSLSKTYWDRIATPASPYKKPTKQRDVASTTLDRWIELMVKNNLIKQYQSTMLKLLADPGIPIGYYHMKKLPSLPPPVSSKRKSMTILFDELYNPRGIKPPEFDPYVSGHRLFLAPILKFDTPNRNGLIHKHSSCFSYRNVLSMKERNRLGL